MFDVVVQPLEKHASINMKEIIILEATDNLEPVPDSHS